MKQRFWKKAASAALALTLVCGALPVNTGLLNLKNMTLTASAADITWFDAETQTLYLKGTVENAGSGLNTPEGTDQADVLHIVAEEGTVLPASCKKLFNGFTSVTDIDLHNADASAVTNMSAMFAELQSLASINLSGLDTSNVKTAEAMFKSCDALTVLTAEALNLKNLTSAAAMFEDCAGLTALDLSGWQTGALLNIQWMFMNCTGLKSLNLSGWNTASVQNMSEAFEGCASLTDLKLTGWNTGSAEDMSYMFSDCSALTALDLSSFDTSNVTDMSAMFSNAVSLTALDLGSFDTSNVESMAGMFTNCRALKTLDLSNFDTSSVISMDGMFTACGSLETVWTSPKWVTDSVASAAGMFAGCGITGEESFTAAPITGISLSLTDDLALNFFVDGVADADAAEEYRVQLKGKCEEADGSTRKLTAKQGGYCAEANVSADHMNEPITVELYKKDGTALKQIYTKTFSVNRYLNKVKPDESWDDSKKTAFNSLVETVKTYGEVSYAYFNTPDAMPAVTDYKDQLETIRDTLTPQNMDDMKISLVLNSRMAVRVYPKDAKAGDTCESGGLTYTAFAGQDGNACFEFTDFTPAMLMDQVSFSLEGETAAHTCAPLSWMIRVFGSDDAASARNVAMANILFEYYTNATNFISQ